MRLNPTLVTFLVTAYNCTYVTGYYICVDDDVIVIVNCIFVVDIIVAIIVVVLEELINYRKVSVQVSYIKYFKFWHTEKIPFIILSKEGFIMNQYN